MIGQYEPTYLLLAVVPAVCTQALAALQKASSEFLLPIVDVVSAPFQRAHAVSTLACIHDCANNGLVAGMFFGTTCLTLQSCHCCSRRSCFALLLATETTTGSHAAHHQGGEDGNANSLHCVDFRYGF